LQFLPNLTGSCLKRFFLPYHSQEFDDTKNLKIQRSSNRRFLVFLILLPNEFSSTYGTTQHFLVPYLRKSAFSILPLDCYLNVEGRYTYLDNLVNYASRSISSSMLHRSTARSQIKSAPCRGWV
jgi:hypothetical protein